MARPIDLNLELEGEDATAFLEGFHHPQVTRKKIDMFKKARAIYRRNRV